MSRGLGQLFKGRSGNSIETLKEVEDREDSKIVARTVEFLTIYTNSLPCLSASLTKTGRQTLPGSLAGPGRNRPGSAREDLCFRSLRWSVGELLL